MKKLLNIDGGGVRVYFSLLILNYIEMKTNKNQKLIIIFCTVVGIDDKSVYLKEEKVCIIVYTFLKFLNILCWI